MIQLDFGDRRPLYEQIKDKLKELIIAGILTEHDSLPSVRELASELAINPNTIQKAYKELENEGYIYSQKAKGSFVSPRGVTVGSADVDSLMDSFCHTVRELMFLGIGYSELTAIAEKIYKEETK